MKEILPQHIAIVMDGNGRWAENRGLLRIEGHRAGVKAVERTIQYALKCQIPMLSLFAFSSENWSRPEVEVEFLMQLFIEALKKEAQDLNKKEVKLVFIGNRTLLPLLLQNEMRAVEELTKNNQRLRLNILVNYGGKWDIIQATRMIASKVRSGDLEVEDINESIFNQYLSTYGIIEPDLLIRTSGELRLSNFFLWQLAYTELYFTNVFWPDFNFEEFQNALNNFQKRERRYGKIFL